MEFGRDKHVIMTAKCGVRDIFRAVGLKRANERRQWKTAEG